mgnify:CR=1 FL=1
MYLHIGSSMTVRDSAIVGIFDLENTTISKHTRAFLKQAEDNGEVVAVAEDLPRAFVLTEEFGMERVYLTQLSAAAIERRSHEAMGLVP